DHFPAGVTVGRYVSIATNVRAFLRNHPMDRPTTHPFFFNADLGYVKHDTIETGTLDIGHDAWIGAGVIITPGCTRIGIGAVVGAGSVVTRDVPDFAIVAGNPAKQLRYRFSEEAQQVVLALRWWERSILDLQNHISEMNEAVGETAAQHPLVRGAA
ncbi:MAG: CatB-related O-acetyltransferase, partial [Phycisphaerales bacterium]